MLLAKSKVKSLKIANYMTRSLRNVILAKRVVINVRKTFKRENLGVIRAMKWRDFTIWVTISSGFSLVVSGILGIESGIQI